MLWATATEAKNSLGALLAKVRDGETVLITSHGTPIATIAPVDSGLMGGGEAGIAHLVADGVFNPPRESLDLEELFSKQVPTLPSGLTAVDLIDRERDGRY